MKLDPVEEMLDAPEIVLRWLRNKKISFKDISEAYVRILEEDSRRNRVINYGMSVPLIQWWSKSKEKNNQDIFLKAKAAFYLLACGVFATAPIEKELQQYVDRFPDKKKNFEEELGEL